MNTHIHTAGETLYRSLPGSIGPGSTGLPPGLDDHDDDSLRHISEAVHRVNEAVLRAVNSGLSVELVRTSRCHDERGNWGDQVTPSIRKGARL